jgi:auxin response factor
MLLLFLCRIGSSEFIIPIHKFLKSLDYSYSVGMRFRMRFESEDAAERRFVHDSVFCIQITLFKRILIMFLLLCRFTGLIIGITDVDPVRWPGSKWKCLVVFCWDLSNFVY